MIELYMIVCLISDHAKCEAKSLQFDGEKLTPMQLMTVAQQEIAKWMCGHPGTYVQRYGARRAGLEAHA